MPNSIRSHPVKREQHDGIETLKGINFRREVRQFGTSRRKLRKIFLVMFRIKAFGDQKPLKMERYDKNLSV